jgi:hypothetical protein
LAVQDKTIRDISFISRKSARDIVEEIVYLQIGGSCLLMPRSKNSSIDKDTGSSQTKTSSPGGQPKKKKKRKIDDADAQKENKSIPLKALKKDEKEDKAQEEHIPLKASNKEENEAQEEQASTGTRIKYKGMTGSDKQRTTSDVLKNDQSQSEHEQLRIVQFGGATGSTAGDAALISLKGSRRRMVIDVGNEPHQTGSLINLLKQVKHVDPRSSSESQADTADESSDNDSDGNNLKPEEATKQIIFITHWHQDHAGSAPLWNPLKENIATYLRDKNAKEQQLPMLIYGQREATKNYAELAKEMPNWQINSEKMGQEQKTTEKIFAWKTGKQGKTKGEATSNELRVKLLVKAYAILPPVIHLKEKAQNTESLGVLTIVENIDSRERLFTMVSLGDMESETKIKNNPVAKVVKDVQDKYCENVPVDVVKISHHGSANNLHVIPEGLITSDTTVIISGYTGTEANKLINKIQEWKPKNLIVLFQNKEGTIAELFKTEDWKKFQNTKWGKDNTTRPVLANSLVVTVDDAGTVTIEATKLD